MKRTPTIITAGMVLVIAVAAPGLAGAHDHGTSAFERVLPHYEAVHRALAADTLDGVAEHARAIREIAAGTARTFSPQQAGVVSDQGQECRALLPDVAHAAARLAKATTLDEAREAFGELSRPMVRWREMATGSRKPKVVYCPMAKKPWLQESDQITNPYFGSRMLRCGNIVSK